ncbi:MAG: hypothetical protein R6U94_12585 [Nitriliruptoraceae bacterium]
MSRPDLTEIVSAVLAELDQAPAASLARGPGGRPEVPMRRVAAADPPPGPGAGASDEVTPTTGATRRGATPARGTPAAIPPVTVAEATAGSAAPIGGATGRSEAVQRIVADLQRRLGEPAHG